MATSRVHRRRLRGGLKPPPGVGLPPLPFRGGESETPFFPALSIVERLGADQDAQGRGVTIAFLDSGFSDHRDLLYPPGRILVHATTGRGVPVERVFEAGWIDGWPEGPADPDLRWHGTMVAAVGAGSGLSSHGRFRGLAPAARLVLVRVPNSRHRIKAGEVRQGLQWILRNRSRFDIRVVNLSIGGDVAESLAESPIDQLVTALTDAGVVVVAAAGNGTGGVVPPASARDSITVGGLNDQNHDDPKQFERWPSRGGPTLDRIAKPDLVAPSVWLPAPTVAGTKVALQATLLTMLRAASPTTRALLIKEHRRLLPKTFVAARGDRLTALIARRIRELKLVDEHYQHVDGTSFAAPLVSGTIAQMIEVAPKLSPRELKSILLASAKTLPIGAEGQLVKVLDPARAVAAARASASGRSTLG